MMDKFWFLTKNSFMKKVKSKWFVIVNIILLVAIVGVMNIDSIIKMFGGDFDETKEIIVVNKTLNNNAVKYIETSINTLNDTLDLEYEFEITTRNDDIDTIKKDIEGTKKIIIVLENDDVNVVKASVISDSYIETAYYQLIYQSLTAVKQQIALELSSINPYELIKVTNPITIDRVFLSDDKNSTEESMEMVMGTVFPTVILPFFLLVIFLIQMIGAEINEEKTTRSMEVIISNVSPKTHFFSKMLASNGFVLMQGALLIIYSLIALWIKNTFGVSSSSSITSEISKIWDSLTSSGFVDKLWYIIPLTLGLMILSFITYSLVAGILASMTVSMEDFQQIQTPIMMILLAAYYLAIMAGMFNGSILIRLLSYVPFISCLLSPALLVLGQIGIIDVFISMIILIVFNYLLIKYGLRVYKIGILNYSTDEMWKKIFKAAKTKN